LHIASPANFDLRRVSIKDEVHRHILLPNASVKRARYERRL